MEQGAALPHQTQELHIGGEQIFLSLFLALSARSVQVVLNLLLPGSFPKASLSALYGI